MKALPYLAVASYDCDRDGSTLTVLVSNVGAAKLKKTVLSIFDDEGKRIANKTVPALEAPIDFLEKSVRLKFKDVPKNGELRVVVDENNKQKELYKRNNSAVVR